MASCHPNREACYKTADLCKSCYNSQWKPTKEQNKRRNSLPAAKNRKDKWRNKQGADFIKEKHRLARYGITPEQFEAMKFKQHNSCRICLTPFGRVCIDHNHETGEVRALLCTKCNAALGMVNDKEFNLARLIAYLKTTNTIKAIENWADCRFVDLP